VNFVHGTFGGNGTFGGDTRAQRRPYHAPQIERLGSARTLRAKLENAAEIDLPWDEIFGAAEALEGTADAGDGTDFDYGANVAGDDDGDEAPASTPAPKQERTPEVQSKPEPKAEQPAAAAAPAAAKSGRKLRMDTKGLEEDG
jgi:hypothetical protein